MKLIFKIKELLKNSTQRVLPRLRYPAGTRFRAGDSAGGGPPPERTPIPKAFLWCGGSTAGGGGRSRTRSEAACHRKPSSARHPLGPGVFQKFFNKKGVALLMVLLTITLMVDAVVEFAYNARVNYRFAIREKQRLQAYYLARSSLNFTKIILKEYKAQLKNVESAGVDTSAYTATPFYRQYQFSSIILRSILSGDLSSLTSEEETTEETTIPKVDHAAKEKIEDFLSFDGDFDVEISEEQTKYDLNKIYGVDSQGNSYDQRKKILFSILKLPLFKDYFEDQNEQAENLTHTITDWVDSNGVINEFDGIQGGSESSPYLKDDYPVKNGKMLTLSELRLVAEVHDKLFEVLRDFVTIYSGDNKINACLADEDMVKALIYHYVQHAGCASNIDYEDEEKFNNLVSVTLGSCPDTEAMTLSLNTELGLVEEEEGETKLNTNECKFQFQDLLTSDNDILSVKATGQVGDTVLTLDTVIDIKSDKTDEWKTYYYKIM